MHTRTHTHTCPSCAACPRLGRLSGSQLGDWYIQSHLMHLFILSRLNLWAHTWSSWVSHSGAEHLKTRDNKLSCEEKCTIMRNDEHEVITLRSIITFLFFFFSFYPRLIIEFNYSGSIFLICFPYFLANWLCLPVFSCLLFTFSHLLASLSQFGECILAC